MAETKRYEKTIRLRENLLSKIRALLEKEPSDESECFGEDETITETVQFENGFEMDIKCCGVQYQEDESNLAWTEAVLFQNGSEVSHSDVGSEFEGDWELKDNDGNTYVVHVISEKQIQ